ncbi:hypothetical protein HOP50_02g13500 [Chloropicon primus]|uniref:Uncharacterized protein n=1 Tax=Chloropicon primus TaxID=1764295 RepID=A0A5B8MGP1_9CHLO|nr:hypothetical protein A3770_02p13630 [Chloropicon primus]UPQ98052.1 hypothetical protein HOP50_02g13500 [Chloropicon primus]|mmetsp:Transcript_8561/g.24491  ORF Transcript_8561/g.24491 Transcript_8561/m.24491 type:complete len:416 (+) Transcript_8561:325-1572(+)|eukprot:QDZ18845.1 hypothetical protein A3770_02p13630 [Chloropicon primus]
MPTAPGGKRMRKVGSCQDLVNEIVGAFSAAVLKGLRNGEGEDKKEVQGLLAFGAYRDMWVSQNLTRRVLELIKREAGSTREACVAVQELFASCVQSATFVPTRAWAMGGNRNRTFVDHLRDMSRHCAGIYTAYVIYAIQPVHPKVRIYLPYTAAEELFHVLWDLRYEAGLLDCHAIAKRLSGEDAFVFGALNRDKRSASYPQNYGSLTFESWKDVKRAEEVAKSGLRGVEDQLDKKKLSEYNERIKEVVGVPVTFDLAAKIESMQTELRDGVNEILQARIDLQKQKPPRASGGLLFSQRKKYEFQQHHKDEAEGEDDAEADGSFDASISALPAKWRRKLKQLEEKKREEREELERSRKKKRKPGAGKGRRGRKQPKRRAKEKREEEEKEEGEISFSEDEFEQLAYLLEETLDDDE